MSNRKVTKFTQADLTPLIGRSVDVVHGPVVDADLYILDVGKTFLFGRRPHSPDPMIPIDEITEVSWDEKTHHSIKLDKALND